MLRVPKLIDCVREHAFKHGDFTLSSGAKSDYFIDMSKVLNRSDCLDLVTQTIIHWIEFENDWLCHAVGGPVLGAASLVGGMLVTYKRNFYSSGLLHGFLVRKEAKAGELIEGVLCPGDNVLILEDVVTSGRQVQRAVDIVEKAGGVVRAIVAVVDRLAGAKELLGERFHSMMTVDDLKEGENGQEIFH